MKVTKPCIIDGKNFSSHSENVFHSIASNSKPQSAHEYSKHALRSFRDHQELRKSFAIISFHRCRNNRVVVEKVFKFRHFSKFSSPFQNKIKMPSALQTNTKVTLQRCFREMQILGHTPLELCALTAGNQNKTCTSRKSLHRLSRPTDPVAASPEAFLLILHGSNN